MFYFVLNALILLMGGSLVIGGARLVLLGGTPGYLLLGGLMMLSAILLFLRRPGGLFVYAGAMVFNLVWGLWEVGLDWWVLAPRSGVVTFFGLLMLLPLVRRTLKSEGTPGNTWRREVATLVGASAISAIVALLTLFSDPHDINGQFAENRMQAVGSARTEVADGEWRMASLRKNSRRSKVLAANSDHTRERKSVGSCMGIPRW